LSHIEGQVKMPIHTIEIVYTTFGEMTEHLLNSSISCEYIRVAYCFVTEGYNTIYLYSKLALNDIVIISGNFA